MSGQNTTNGSVSEQKTTNGSVSRQNTTNESVSDYQGKKIKFCVRNSVIGIVKSINEDTIEQYCEFIEDTFPPNPADWVALKREMVVAARKGPKIFVKCCRGKLTGYNKMDNVKIVAFIKQNESNSGEGG